MSSFFKSQSLDLLGFCGSVLCGVHCAALPVLLGFSFFSFLAWPIVEFLLIGFALLIAFLSLIPAYLKRHYKALPLGILLVGFAFIVVGRVIESPLVEVMGTLIGSSLIGSAHLVNRKILMDLELNRSTDSSKS